VVGYQRHEGQAASFLTYHITKRFQNSEDRELNVYLRENLTSPRFSVLLNPKIVFAVHRR
jgi:hypothetical protein